MKACSEGRAGDVPGLRTVLLVTVLVILFVTLLVTLSSNPCHTVLLVSDKFCHNVLLITLLVFLIFTLVVALLATSPLCHIALLVTLLATLLAYFTTLLCLPDCPLCPTCFFP